MSACVTSSWHSLHSPLSIAVTALPPTANSSRQKRRSGQGVCAQVYDTSERAMKQYPLTATARVPVTSARLPQKRTRTMLRSSSEKTRVPLSDPCRLVSPSCEMTKGWVALRNTRKRIEDVEWSRKAPRFSAEMPDETPRDDCQPVLGRRRAGPPSGKPGSNAVSGGWLMVVQ